MADELKKIVLNRRWTDHQTRDLRDQVRRQLLASNHGPDDENFRRIHPELLSVAFDTYDQIFFERRCREHLDRSGQPLKFSFSRRMTNAAGMTVRHEQFRATRSQPATQYEIKLSATLLFESFRDHGSIMVSGCRCDNRLEALMRIMEHEMVHLIEMMLWYDSSCSRQRFRGIAKRCFDHRESTHQLLRPVDTAREKFGIRPGDRVSFDYAGRRLAGLVNRITRRATVLVPDPKGTRYSDGRRYAKYYVPVADLQRIP